MLPALVFALGTQAAAPAGAYQFLLSSKLSWDRAIWPPGGTLSVTVVDSPAWYEGPGGFDDIAGVRRTVRAALDVWASIPTADIRWEIGEVISRAEWLERRNNSSRGGMLSIGVNNISSRRGHAELISKPGNRLTLHACYVEMIVPTFEVLVHELGHCLGLGHAELLSEEGSESGRMAPDYPSYWRYDPVMSYGISASWPEDLLTSDDMIGASLLRPAPGWLETTGSIVGRVTLPDGTPANGAYVLATRLLEPEEASYSVGVFAEPTGEFDIGGLAPGDYQLLVRSPSGRGNEHFFQTRGPLLSNGTRAPKVVLDLRQALRAAPVRVRTSDVRLLSLTVRRRGDPFR